MKFVYQARTKEGKFKEGIVEASSKEAALDLLQKYDLYVTFLEEKSTPIYMKEISLFQGVSKKELVLFFRQLTIMFKSKVPLVEALETAGEQIKNKYFKSKILKIVEEVEGGNSLSIALSSHQDIFSPFIIAVVKSGELSGKLSESFEYLADHIEREYEFRGKLIGAMIYPLFILFIALAIFSLMVFFILPQIKAIFESSNVELPLLTKIIFTIGDFLREKLKILILFSLSFLILSLSFKNTPKGKKVFSWLSLNIPFLKEFFKKIYLARIAENLSTLVSAGLAITTSLEITSEVVGNEIYKKAVLAVQEEVKRGEQISNAVKSFPNLFPPLFGQMILVGEKTGTLDTTLTHLVEFYQKEVSRAIESFLKMLEPLLLATIAVGVGIFAVAVITPIYKMMGQGA